MTDRELDDILYAALVVLNTPEYLELPDEPFPTSPEFEAKMENMMADPDGYVKKYRRAARPLWRKVLTTAAVVLLVLSVSLASVMAVSPTARAWVERVVVEWLEEYVGFSFQGVDNQSEKNWRLTWLPDGFEQVSEDYGPDFGYVVYASTDGGELFFDYKLTVDGNQYNVDIENKEYQLVKINGKSAYLFIANKEGFLNSLIWSSKDDSVVFQLMGNVGEKDLICMAENII